MFAAWKNTISIELLKSKTFSRMSTFRKQEQTRNKDSLKKLGIDGLLKNVSENYTFSRAGDYIFIILR